jgi:hypothetical protein
MRNSVLPRGFEDLEVFVSEWSLPLESERNQKRISSTMDQLQTLYDAMLPRMEELVRYLDQFPLDEMPDDAKRLLYLAFSLMEIAMPVEVLGSPNMPDSVDDRRLEFVSEKKPLLRHRSGHARDERASPPQRKDSADQ